MTVYRQLHEHRYFSTGGSLSSYVWKFYTDLPTGRLFHVQESRAHIPEQRLDTA